mgnify:CR=1 FL=1
MSVLDEIKVKLNFTTDKERLNQYLSYFKNGFVLEFDVKYLFASGICKAEVEEVVKEK